MGYLSKEPKKKMGRPMKYSNLLKTLYTEDLFTPASIAHEALESEFISGDLPAAERNKQAQRIRITMGRLSKNRSFPTNGDGWRRLKGQAPMPAWFGWRWQDAGRGIEFS